MKLGFLSAILPEYTFDQVVDYAGELGLRAVELACWPMGKATRRYAGVTHIDADAYDKQAIWAKLEEKMWRFRGWGTIRTRSTRIKRRASLPSRILKSSSMWRRI